MGQRRKDREWPRQRLIHILWAQSGEDHQAPDPGLAVEWRRWNGAWYCFAIVVLDRPGRSPAVLQRWYHQRDVTPARPPPGSPDPDRWHLGWNDDQPTRSNPGVQPTP
ncbi:hypothetical protein [uncultured Friedmanniella sp.]|uniref:hypothetical protein n=1 Tax=uncultured Friedmanniella sp. TaxID=335381 RepID=UPI0035CB757C